jgi:hypothetical protein
MTSSSYLNGTLNRSPAICMTVMSKPTFFAHHFYTEFKELIHEKLLLPFKDRTIKLFFSNDKRSNGGLRINHYFGQFPLSISSI